MKEILREIGMIGRCCATISDIEFKEISLAKGQYLYLVRIYENPGIIQERVAVMLKVDRSTAAKAIKKLVECGLVEKVREEDNKKELRLYCTSRGKEIYPLLKREEEHSVEVATEGMTSEEIKQAFELLHRMRKNIEREWEEIKRGNPRRY